MEYRKFKADHIFTGFELIEGNKVLVTGNEGMILDILDDGDAGEDILQFSGMLCPGFINCHCHLELSHLKGVIPEGTGLVDFILKVVNGRQVEEGIILQAIADAEKEMWQNGIVAVGDICNHTSTIPQKLKGRLLYHNFIEVSGFPPAIAEARFLHSKNILDSFHAVFSPAQSTISPHAPYSVSQDLFQLISNFSGNRLLTMHNQETVAENEFFTKGHGDLLRLYEQMGIGISFFKPVGKSSLQTVLPYFNKNQPVILVHNVSTSAEDIDHIQYAMANQQCAAQICLCPNANLYISNTLPDIDLLISKGCIIVLGTDSLASNHQLSILEEMKTLQKNFPLLEMTRLLQWATINGARALKLDDKLGSFEQGKKPGVVLLEGLDEEGLITSARARRII